MQQPIHIAETHNDAAQAVAEVLAPFASRARGGRVLIKPNLHGGHGYTAPEIIEAAVVWAEKAGAAEVVLGEGPYYGLEDMTAYLAETGVAELCRKLEVKFVNFHRGDYLVSSPNIPDLPETVGVTKWLSWADLSISIPVMKTHFNTLTTLAFKNLKGFIRPRDKRDIHKLDIHGAVAALPLVVKPHIHLLDATVAYEGMGPAAGTPVEMGLVLSSVDPFSLDVVANWLMGVQPAAVRYLRRAEQLGLGALPPDDQALAALCGLPLDSLARWRRRFLLPHEAAGVDFPDLTISTQLACSGCLMNLFAALRDLHAQGFASRLRGTVAVGKPPAGRDLAVGNCTFAAWDDAPGLPGCPPSIDEIKEALRRTLLGR